jgi:2-polyprenyl-6-methoxyphenol hydroxylase-like FAD-dependent oxidoreductase
MPTDVDVLVVGAGPTGLSLATQLSRFGVRFRIVDKARDRARESRALAVQARSLEVLQSVGLGEVLAARGSTTTRLMLHVDRGEPVVIDLGTIERADTRFPYVLFIPQSDTEAVLADHLVSRGVAIERGVELVGFHAEDDGVLANLQHLDGRNERIAAGYVVGCDGAHSTVRKATGIPFEGGAYPQEFALGDLEADGPLVPGAINAFGAGRGFAMFFPLGHPTTWRVMAVELPTERRRSAVELDDVATHDLSLAELQGMIDAPTSRSVNVRDAAWLTRFRLHHRQAARYRDGRVFLAGDAAHVHSPVGGQGMNTGIQDAWNLGWKLALVVQARAGDALIDSYQAERWPVGRTLLRVTDRLFSAFAASLTGNRLMMMFRRAFLRDVVSTAVARQGVRARAFHYVSQLGIRYRDSAAVTEGNPPLHEGPRAGDRLPDASVQSNGRATYLQQELSSPHMQLLLCGPRTLWNDRELARLTETFGAVLRVTYLTRTSEEASLLDQDGEAFKRLGVSSAAQYIVRPDGYVAFRCAGTDLAEAAQYLRRWFIHA